MLAPPIFVALPAYIQPRILSKHAHRERWLRK